MYIYIYIYVAGLRTFQAPMSSPPDVANLIWGLNYSFNMYFKKRSSMNMNWNNMNKI